MIKKDTIKPTGTRLLVQRIVEEERTESGLLLTAGLIHKDYSAKGREGGGSAMLEAKGVEEEDNLMQLRVLAVGPDALDFNVGGTVLTNKYAGLDIYNDRTIFLINSTDIIATIG